MQMLNAVNYIYQKLIFNYNLLIDRSVILSNNHHAITELSIN